MTAPEDSGGCIDDFALLDRHRSVDLDDVGGRGLTLAVAVDSDGAEHLGVVERQSLGDGAAGFSRSAPGHENLGPLPFEFTKRIAVVARGGRCSHDTIRCGRPTGTGTPCRIPVLFNGDACRWHRNTPE